MHADNELRVLQDAFDADTAPADGPDLGFGAFPFGGGDGTTPRTPGFGASPFEPPQHAGLVSCWGMQHTLDMPRLSLKAG